MEKVHAEIDPTTMELIFDLLVNVENCIEKRGSLDYDEYLKQIPRSHAEKLHHIFQFGVAFCIQLFEARRGGQNLATLKKIDFVDMGDFDNHFKYIKRVSAEKKKNDGSGTNSDLFGSIPYIDFDKFNPGRYIARYMACLPDGDDDLGLFMKPKINSEKFNINDGQEKVLYESNIRVRKNDIQKMFGQLCDLVGRPLQTNQTLRSSAVVYMKRAGLSWDVICKITGNNQVDNLVGHYGTKLETQGLADVGIAIGHGASVALGDPPLRLKLVNSNKNQEDINDG